MDRQKLLTHTSDMPLNPQTLFDTAFQAQHRARSASGRAARPLMVHAQKALEERQADLKKPLPPVRLSCLELQSENDLPGTLARLHAELPVGGLFLGVLLGGQTLHELRASLMEAELALTGGASPRVAPMAEAGDLSRLLTASGFALPVIDTERVEATYPDLWALMRELRAMGCANSLSERPRRFTSRRLFETAATLYAERFPGPTGGLRATFDLIYLHGWKG